MIECESQDHARPAEDTVDSLFSSGQGAKLLLYQTKALKTQMFYLNENKKNREKK